MSSGLASRVRRSRPRLARSHFEVEVPLQLLNASPTGSGSRQERRPLSHGYVFLEADIPEAATAAPVLASFLPCPDGGGSASRQTFPDAEASRGEARLPAMSEETRRLLREVKDVRRRAMHELEEERQREAARFEASSLSPRAFFPRLMPPEAEDPPGMASSSDKENKSDRVSAVASDNMDSMSSRERKRKVVDIMGRRKKAGKFFGQDPSSSSSGATHNQAPTFNESFPWSRALRLQDRAAQTEVTSHRVVHFDDDEKLYVEVERPPAPPERRSRSADPPGGNREEEGAISEERRSRSEEGKRTPSREEEEECLRQAREQKQSLREKRAKEKPWRCNMRLGAPSDEPVKKEGQEEEKEYHHKVGGGEVEDEMAKKPWRHNMKNKQKQTAEKHKDKADEEAAKKTGADKVAVKRYILLKRKKAQEERKRKEREEKARKEQIKNRLVALEQERRNDYLQAKAKTTSSEKPELKVTPKTAVEVEKEQRLLRKTLEELTNRIRKSSYNVREEKNLQKRREEEEEVDVVPQQTPDKEALGTVPVETSCNFGKEDKDKDVGGTLKPAGNRPDEEGHVRGPEEEVEASALPKPSWGQRRQSGEEEKEAKGNNEAEVANKVGRKTTLVSIGCTDDDDDDDDDVPVRDESARVPRGNEKRRRMLSEVFARHQRDLEDVRRLNRNINWQQATTITAAATAETEREDVRGLNFIGAVRRKGECDPVRVRGEPPHRGQEGDGEAVRSPRQGGDSPEANEASQTKGTGRGEGEDLPEVEAEEGESTSQPTASSLSRSVAASMQGQSSGREGAALGEDVPKVKGGPEHAQSMTVPTALRLRFMAEMNQLEAMQELEKHLANVRQLQVAARSDARAYDAHMAAARKKAKEARQTQKKKGRSESRRDFEARLRQEFQEILSSRMERILSRRTEAKRDFTSAAEQLERIGRKRTEAVGKGTDGVALSLLRKAESDLPEVMDAIHKTEQSGESLPRTISEVMKALSGEDGTVFSSRNVTEEIAQDLSGVSMTTATELEDDTIVSSKEDGGDTLKQEEPSPKLNSLRNSNLTLGGEVEEDSRKEDDYSSVSTSELKNLVRSNSTSVSAISESEGHHQHHQQQQQITIPTLAQRLEEESVRAKQQYDLLKERELLLVEGAKTELARLEEKKRQIRKEKGPEEKVSKIKKKERAVLLELKNRRSEIDKMKETLRAAEKERKSLLKQQRSLAKRGRKRPDIGANSAVASSLEEEGRTSRHTRNAEGDPPSVDRKSTDLEEETPRRYPAPARKDNDADSERQKESNDASKDSSESEQSQGRDRVPPCSPSKMESLKKTLGTTLKTPLSPKSSSGGAGGSGRRRHSSADSEESISLSHSEDHSSDIEIRINALRDELTQRMRMAARLKQQQRQKNREKMRAQELTLKKQIEKYDKLIQETRSELEDREGLVAVVVMPPQIKKPRQAVAADPSSRRLSLDEATLSRVAEDILSPQRSPVAESVSEVSPPSSAGAKHLGMQQETSLASSVTTKTESPEMNYSDDFTSSNASAVSEIDTAAAGAQKEARKQEEEEEKEEKVVLWVEPGEAARSRKDRLADEITRNILDEVLREACAQVKKIRETTRDGSQKGAMQDLPKSGKDDSASKARTRPQDLMLTTFDISSESSDENESQRAQKVAACPSSSPRRTAEHLHDDTLSSGEVVKVDEFNDFIDDDFGLSSIRRESEQIRQQQLLIEQEIDRIQQETNLGRPIPTKPPPPYTPPPPASSLKILGQAPPPSPSPRPESEPKLIPSEREEVDCIVAAIAGKLFGTKEDERGAALAVRLMEAAEEAAPDKGKMAAAGKKSRRMFLIFLCDLCEEVVSDVFRCEGRTQNPPWLPQLPLRKECLGLPSTVEQLSSRVRSEVAILLGHERRAKKEDLVVRWSQKKRDRVDQILVRELHAEEVEWTDYSMDEAAVKDQVAEAIALLLVEDTASELEELWKQRRRRENPK